jgi:hypothetical protein
VRLATTALELEVEEILSSEPGITDLRKQENDPYRSS